MCWSINLSVPSCSVSRLPLSSWLLTPRSKPRHLDMHIDECDAPLDETIIHLLVSFSASSIYRTSCLVLILHAPTATKVTFNFGITSHDNFEGNDLTFCGMFDAADHRKYHHTNLVGTKSAHLHSIMLQCLPVAHGLPRFTSIIMHYHCIMVGVGRTSFCLADCWFYLRYKHAKGRCVVHSGKRRHGAMDIEKVAELEFTDVTTCSVKGCLIRDFDGRSILPLERFTTVARLCQSEHGWRSASVASRCVCTGRARLPYHVDQEQNLPSNTGRAVRAEHFNRSTGSKFHLWSFGLSW